MKAGERVQVQEPVKTEAQQAHEELVESWNAFVSAMELAKDNWEKHHEIYKKRMRFIGTLPRSAQKLLAGIVHKQRFDFVLDYYASYAKTGFGSLMIKEEAENGL